jgi:hypothetical protein
MFRLVLMLSGASVFAAIFAARAFVDGGRVSDGVLSTALSLAFLVGAVLLGKRYFARRR